MTVYRRILLILALSLVLGCDAEKTPAPQDKMAVKAVDAGKDQSKPANQDAPDTPVDKVIEKIEAVKEQAKKVVTDKETRRVVCLAVIYGLKKAGSGMVFKGISGIGTVPLEMSAGLIIGGAVIFSGAKLLEDRFELWGYIKDDPAKEVRFTIPLKTNGQELAELKNIEVQFHKLDLGPEDDLQSMIKEIENQYTTEQSGNAAQQYSLPLTGS
ncbi:MAG: hypothetical protein P1V97_02770 [Planctomycetota bacterium]|nr:hypothetical protein [Planctomycetota bacterium]